MNRNHLRHTAGIFAVLIAIVACVLPGQAAPPAPAPAVDVNALSTAVAGTAQAAANQTAAVQPTGTGLTGTTIEQLEDGTTRYSDYDGGFEMVFPAGWLAVRPNSEEFNTALTHEAKGNKALHDQMTADQAGYDAEFDRLYAYILRPDLKKGALFGFSKLTWDSQDTLSIDSVSMGNLVRDLESPSGIPNFRADTAQLHQDGTVPLMEIGGPFTMTASDGGAVALYTTIVFFKPSSSSTARITFTFVQDHHTEVYTDVSSVLASIRIIEP
jgi:hypothetical protein